MAREPDENVGTTVEGSTMSSNEENLVNGKKSKEVSKKKKKSKGIFSRMWNSIFSTGKDDFERRLERISKEEATILARMRQRAQNWGKMKRNLILFSVLLEFVAVGYALTTAREAENWKIRALRVLPMFLLPVVSSATYSAVSSIINMCAYEPLGYLLLIALYCSHLSGERKDLKTLENLRTERQQKIDELKEKTNYYITQQLIQRYDTDPAAKAAAATVLASKLGAESGLKVFLEEESKKIDAPTGKSNDIEHVQSSGLRNRKQAQSRATSPGGTVQNSSEPSLVGNEYLENRQIFVDHYQPRGATAYNNGWFSRIAALLVGEDPTQCYALICGNCRSHNGLASKEDFPFVTYICPHCHAVNGPKIQPGHVSGSGPPNTVSTDTGNASSTVCNSPHGVGTSDPDVSNPEVTPLVSEEIVRPEASTEGNEK